MHSILLFLAKYLWLKRVHVDELLPKTIGLRIPNVLHDMKGGQHRWQLILNSMSVKRTFTLTTNNLVTTTAVSSIQQHSISRGTPLTKHNNLVQWRQKVPMATTAALLQIPRSAVNHADSLKPRLHDTTCCQTGCQTGLTTGCIVLLRCSARGTQ